MTTQSQVATHDGTVISSNDGKVTVLMQVISACSTCKAHEKCAFVDKDQKIVEIHTPQWQQYTAGQQVTVCVSEKLGLLAVLIAYFLPALLIVGSIVILSLLHLSEILVATLSIILIVLYFLILYRFQPRIQKKFSFSIQ